MRWPRALCLFAEIHPASFSTPSLNREPVAPVRLNPDLPAKTGRNHQSRNRERPRSALPARVRPARGIAEAEARQQLGPLASRCHRSEERRRRRQNKSHNAQNHGVNDTPIRKADYYAVRLRSSCWRLGRSVFPLSFVAQRSSAQQRLGAAHFFYGLRRVPGSFAGRTHASLHPRQWFLSGVRTDLRQVSAGRPARPAHPRLHGKLAPAFSPDGTNIAYSTFNHGTFGKCPFSVVTPHPAAQRFVSHVDRRRQAPAISRRSKRGSTWFLSPRIEGRGQSRDVYVPPRRARHGPSFLSFPRRQMGACLSRWEIAATFCRAAWFPSTVMPP